MLYSNFLNIVACFLGLLTEYLSPRQIIKMIDKMLFVTKPDIFCIPCKLKVRKFPIIVGWPGMRFFTLSVSLPAASLPYYGNLQTSG